MSEPIILGDYKASKRARALSIGSALRVVDRCGGQGTLG